MQNPHQFNLYYYFVNKRTMIFFFFYYFKKELKFFVLKLFFLFIFFYRVVGQLGYPKLHWRIHSDLVKVESCHSILKKKNRIKPTTKKNGLWVCVCVCRCEYNTVVLVKNKNMKKIFFGFPPPPPPYPHMQIFRCLTKMGDKSVLICFFFLNLAIPTAPIQRRKHVWAMAVPHRIARWTSLHFVGVADTNNNSTLTAVALVAVVIRQMRALPIFLIKKKKFKKNK